MLSQDRFVMPSSGSWFGRHGSMIDERGASKTVAPKDSDSPECSEPSESADDINTSHCTGTHFRGHQEYTGERDTSITKKWSLSFKTQAVIVWLIDSNRDNDTLKQ